MRILVANIPLPSNRFLADLNAAIARNAELKQDSEIFWRMEGNFDVVHLHWPEYMTSGHEDAYVGQLTDHLVEATEERLKYWGRRSVLILTRHNLLPHDATCSESWARLYELVCRHVHGVVHLGQPSVDEFRRCYSETGFVHGQPRHCVIPHHNYGSLPNRISREEARDRLKIKHDRRVMLVFGSIRNQQESDLVVKTFGRLRQKRKLLLVSNWRETLANVSWIRLKYWLRDLRRLYCRFHPCYRFHYGFVEEGDAQFFLHAADILFISRLKVLNSGNVPLGLTFGKVVVGPDFGNVGQLLRESGNPVFDPDRPETAVAAVELAFQLADDGALGAANRELASSKWSVDKCANQYLQFFEELSRDGRDRREGDLSHVFRMPGQTGTGSRKSSRIL